MDIPRLDVLPDSSPDVSEDVPTQIAPDAGDTPVTEPVKGSQTPETHLYAALEEERRLRREEAQRRRELEQKLKEMELSSALSKLDDNDLSEEGRALKQELSSVREEFKSFKEQTEEQRVLNQYPQLKDRTDDFESFKSLYPGVPLDKIAKLFIVEYGLIEPEKPRKGLEKTVGGTKDAPTSGLTAEDIERLMKTNPRKFNKMIQDGAINPDNFSW